GTGLKGSFAADTSYTIGTTYPQAQVQALANGLREARQRVKALEDALRSHGLIN
ncbi:phage tail protein, partial [Pantoea sp. SIMBA_079]